MAKRRTPGQSRADLWAQTESVLSELAKPRTADELATRAHLGLRTVYRILAELPAMGVKLDVIEIPRKGRGRAERRYQVTALDTNITRSKPDRSAGSLQEVAVPLGKASRRMREALGWTRSVVGIAEEFDAQDFPRQIEAKKRRLLQAAARLLGELEKGDASLALAEVAMRQLTKSG